MVISSKGKGKSAKGVSKGLVRHTDKKIQSGGYSSFSSGQKFVTNGKKGSKGSKGKGKSDTPAEKRIDPSDGNGPFTFASFVRYHGEEKARILWEKAGSGDVSSTKPTKGAQQAGKQNNAAQKGGGQQLRAGAKTTITKKSDAIQNPFAGERQVRTKSQPTDNSTAPPTKKGSLGKKGAGKNSTKGNKGKGKKGPPQEKRMDPSDGNGPFTKASFIRFHGEEKGSLLWEQAGELLAQEAGNTIDAIVDEDDLDDDAGEEEEEMEDHLPGQEDGEEMMEDGEEGMDDADHDNNPYASHDQDMLGAMDL